MVPKQPITVPHQIWGKTSFRILFEATIFLWHAIVHLRERNLKGIEEINITFFIKPRSFLHNTITVHFLLIQGGGPVPFLHCDSKILGDKFISHIHYWISWYIIIPSLHKTHHIPSNGFYGWIPLLGITHIHGEFSMMNLLNLGE